MPRCQGDARTTGAVGTVWRAGRHRDQRRYSCGAGLSSAQRRLRLQPRLFASLERLQGGTRTQELYRESRPLREVRSLWKPGRRSGPDVLTIGPDSRFMEWDSRRAWRSDGSGRAWPVHAPPARRRKNLCVERDPLARHSARCWRQSDAGIDGRQLQHLHRRHRQCLRRLLRICPQSCFNRTTEVKRCFFHSIR